MATLINNMLQKYTDALSSGQDPEIDKWFLMHSTTTIFAILAVYLCFVLKVGPMLMKNQTAFSLKNVLIVYNLFQVIFYVWLCSLLFRVDDAIYTLINHCGKIGMSEELSGLLAYAGWWYFFSKVIELLDTVFFVLRKKQSQVTFLHVYHHSFMVLGTWAFLKFSRDEQGVMLAFLNSMVHIVMYFYYFVAALGPEYQKYLWWKKYMTWIQLSQFCMMLVYLIHITMMGCSLPRGLTFVLGINVAVFLALFADFYRKAYRKGGPTAKVQQLKKID